MVLNQRKSNPKHLQYFAKLNIFPQVSIFSYKLKIIIEKLGEEILNESPGQDFRLGKKFTPGFALINHPCNMIFSQS